MPELEEGNVYVRGTFPVNVSLDEVADKAGVARSNPAKASRDIVDPEPDGSPRRRHRSTGFYNCEFSVPLKNHDDWPKIAKQVGWKRWSMGHCDHAPR